MYNSLKDTLGNVHNNDDFKRPPSAILNRAIALA